MATASGTSSKKSRAHRSSQKDTATVNLTVDELRDARTAYFGDASSDRVQETAKQSSRDSSTKQRSHRRHESSASKISSRDKKQSNSTEASTRQRRSKRENSNGEYVYKDQRTPERERRPRSDRDKNVTSSRPKRHDGIANDGGNRSDPDVSRSRKSARPHLGRSVSTSQVEPVTQRPTMSRRDTVSATTSKKDDGRKSILGSLFRSATTPAETPRVRTVECLTCGSDDVPITRSAKLRCGHRMCNSCLRRIFSMSVKDPAHMPPRCCTSEHIPLRYVDHLFDTKFKVLWNRKYEEYTTKNRLYCPTRGCGAWIRPSQIYSERGRKFGVCGKCKARVCTRCNENHRPGECPKDPETEKFLATAQEEGWQRCPNCKAMVELKEGCHHITCRCTAEWCFLCTSKWRTCDCPWFNYTEVPDGDRLNHMRIPDLIPMIRRHIFGELDRATGPGADPGGLQQPPNDRNPALRHQEEADARRRQMERDAAFARQLQFIAQRDEVPPPRQNVDQEIFGNAGEHFLNNNFVQETPIVDTAALGDAAFGQRGERASGRRRASNTGNFGPLGPNPFGTDSVLGFGPPPPATAQRTGTTRNAQNRSSKKSGGDMLGRWLARI